MMAVSSFLNSRIVKRFGMRRLSHFALIVYISGSILLVAFSLAGFMPLWLFFSLLMIVQFVFGWAASNMNSLSMEPAPWPAPPLPSSASSRPWAARCSAR